MNRRIHPALPSLKFQKRPFGRLLLALFCAAGNPYYANAQTIQVEAQTQIQIEKNHDQLRITLVDDLNRTLAHQNLEISMIEANSDNKHEFSATTDENGAFIFTPKLPQGDYHVTVYFKAHDGYRSSASSLELSLQDETPQIATNAIERHLPAFFTGLGLLLALAIAAIFARRPSSHHPAAPQKYRPAVVRHKIAAATQPTYAELECRDRHSQTTLSHCHILLQGRDIEVDAWPFKIEIPDKISIFHPDYMTWTGKIRAGDHLVIDLEKRRDYVIACYESTATTLLHKPITWGESSPQALAQCDIAPEKTIELKTFIASVNRAAFDTAPIDDKELDEIYALSRRLASRERLASQKYRKKPRIS